MSRRDIQYYDLYAKQEPSEDYQAMRDEGGFPYTQADAQIKEFYGDLAWLDFNTIFKNQGEVVSR